MHLAEAYYKPCKSARLSSDRLTCSFWIAFLFFFGFPDIIVWRIWMQNSANPGIVIIVIMIMIMVVAMVNSSVAVVGSSVVNQGRRMLVVVRGGIDYAD